MMTQTYMHALASQECGFLLNLVGMPLVNLRGNKGHKVYAINGSAAALNAVGRKPPI